MYLTTQTDISSVIDTQKKMIDYFPKIYIVIICISFPVIFLLTDLITTPIKKVRRAAKRIAGGRYNERISIKGKDEISELAHDFNQMAEQIEEKMVELSDAARQKEDFAANFARVEMESPVRTWDSLENDKAGVVSEEIASERKVLKIKQIEDVIKCWNSRNSLILHEPVAGQISMEEAIKAGEKWLIEMGIGEEKDAAAYTINAELGIGVQTEEAGEQLEAYYSFWKVKYSSQPISAIRYLNAVTGKVWGAEITLYEEPQEKQPDDRLQLFVELAGLKVSDDDSVVIDSGETQTEIAIKDSQLYAQELSYEMVIQSENGYEYIAYQLLVK